MEAAGGFEPPNGGFAGPHPPATIAGISGVCPRGSTEGPFSDTPSLPATVDPLAETMGVYRLEGERYQLAQHASGSDTVRAATLPDLQFPISQLFAE